MRITGKPILCNYYLTYRCNASCSFCDIWEKPSPYATQEHVIANLRDLKKLGVRVIDFTGGEPLLHRRLPDFLALAKGMGFITTVTTNTLLYPKFAGQLKGLVDMLHFSLDSPVEEEHNASRNVKCFDKFMESIVIAKEIGERPDVLFTVTPGNIHHIQEVYETISRPNKLVLILNPLFEYKSSAGIASEDATQVGGSLDPLQLEELSRWGRKKGVYLNQAFISLRKNGGNQVSKPVCKAASTTVVISPENKLIMPCYHLGLEEFEINDKLLEVRNSPKVKEYMAMEGKHAGCQGCTVNCYFQPSFAVELNSYWLEALPSTLKYAMEKRMWSTLWR